ncbi:lipase member H-like [Centruroides sculpturatus]|uniref:lipase member H-like n=1 Tax=Centruroides sculpturatus TaxID=218467 RepID=UPI000C6CE0C3|nr:lipase member H-like [Centruroides sculpturatus]
MLRYLLCILIIKNVAYAVERERNYHLTDGRSPTEDEKDSLLTRCYDKWGCFTIGEPFFNLRRPISLFPLHPDVLDVQFLLMTRKNPDIYQKLRAGNNNSFVISNFEEGKPVKMIVHGYSEDGFQIWIKDLIRELLTAEDSNIISVDWRVGAGPPYTQATANARAVGVVISDFIDYIQHNVYLYIYGLNCLQYKLFFSSDVNMYGKCNYARSIELFSESINSDCPFNGFACDSYLNFTSGRCSEGCGTDMSQCASLGYRADDWRRYARTDPVKMFLETGIAEPYCRYHYHVSVLLSGTDDAVRQGNETGSLFVRISGTKGRTALLQATQEVVLFGPGRTVEFVIGSPNLGRMLRVDVLWHPLATHRQKYSDVYKPEYPQIYIHSFRITNLETSYREVFCAKDEPLDPENIRTVFSGGLC